MAQIISFTFSIGAITEIWIYGMPFLLSTKLYTCIDNTIPVIAFFFSSFFILLWLFPLFSARPQSCWLVPRARVRMQGPLSSMFHKDGSVTFSMNAPWMRLPSSCPCTSAWDSHFGAFVTLRASGLIWFLCLATPQFSVLLVYPLPTECSQQIVPQMKGFKTLIFWLCQPLQPI